MTATPILDLEKDHPTPRRTGWRFFIWIAIGASIGLFLALTPNLPEAAALLPAALAHSEAQLHEQMPALQRLGAAAVLLKGGHEAPAVDGQVTDRLLAADGELLHLRRVRVMGSRRGTGCSLASAIAAQLALGTPLAAACAAAQAYVAAALAGEPWTSPPP